MDIGTETSTSTQTDGMRTDIGTWTKMDTLRTPERNSPYNENKGPDCGYPEWHGEAWYGEDLNDHEPYGGDEQWYGEPAEDGEEWGDAEEWNGNDT